MCELLANTAIKDINIKTNTNAENNIIFDFFFILNISFIFIYSSRCAVKLDRIGNSLRFIIRLCRISERIIAVLSIVVCSYTVNGFAKSLTAKRCTFSAKSKIWSFVFLVLRTIHSFSSYITSIIATDFQWHTESKHSEILFNCQLKLILNISNKIKSNKKATIKLVGKFSPAIETIVAINNINTIKKQ